MKLMIDDKKENAIEYKNREAISHTIVFFSDESKEEKIGILVPEYDNFLNFLKNTENNEIKLYIIDTMLLIDSINSKIHYVIYLEDEYLSFIKIHKNLYFFILNNNSDIDYYYYLDKIIGI